MARAKRTGSATDAAATDQSEESAVGQPGRQEEPEQGAGGRGLPERMPQWRTGNPNNSGFAGDVMERLEERWQEKKGPK